MVTAPTTDAQVMDALAPATDRRWLDLFTMPLWSDPSKAQERDLVLLIQRLYDLGLILSFDWPAWYRPDRFPAGEGLGAAPAADAVRLLTAVVRGDRFCEGALLGLLVDGSVLAAVTRLWNWYRSCLVGDGDFVDRAEYLNRPGIGRDPTAWE